MNLFRRRRPSPSQIETVFINEIAPELEGLEADRRRAAMLTIIGIGTGILGFVWALFFMDDSGQFAQMALNVLGSKRSVSDVTFRGLPALEFAGVILALPVLIGLAVRRPALDRFRLRFKNEVLAKVIQHFYPDLRYFPSGYITRSEYDASGLFRVDLSSYEGNDKFVGKVGEVDFEFSEILAKDTTGSGRNRRTRVEFRGLFFIGDFHRQVSGRTEIRPDNAEALLGFVGRGLQRVAAGGRLVDLENPDFEHMFVVTSDDQIAARMILTPAFMQKIVDFSKRSQLTPHMAFRNGKLYMAMGLSRDLFEPRLFGSIFNRDDLKDAISFLQFMWEVVDGFLVHPAMAKAPPALTRPRIIAAVKRG